MDWRHKCRSAPNSRERELFLVPRVGVKAAMGVRGDGTPQSGQPVSRWWE